MGLNIIVGLEIFYPQINGLVTTTMNLIKNLKELGHNPIIVTPKIAKNQDSFVKGIPVYYAPSSSALVYPGLRLVNTKSPIFKKIIEKHKVDIIQTTAPWYIAKGLHRVGKKKNIPMINTFHTNLHDPGYMQYVAPMFMNKHTVDIASKTVWSTSRQFLNPCQIITAPSPNTCKDLEQAYPEKRIEWIPNGVHLEMFTQSINENMLQTLIPDIVNNKKKYAIFVGRQAQEKLVDILIQSVVHTIKTISDFTIVIVGDGPKRKYYMQLAQKLNVENNIVFLGHLDHELLLESGLLKKAQFFTTASITETHSMTVTESLCSGIPVVVPEHDSMTYFTDTTGLHFEPNNPESMSKAHIALWTNTELYEEKKQATQSMLEKFDGKKVAKQYLALYYELLHSQKKS